MTGAWQRVRRVLAVRLDAFGDVLMTTPALRALRPPDSGRHLTLLTSTAGAAAAALVPDVDATLVYDAPWMKATADRPAGVVDRALLRTVVAGRFDAAVVFTVYSQSALPAALVCWAAGIPLRLAHCRENPYQLLTDWVPDPEPDRVLRHEVVRQLALVATVGARVDDDRLRVAIPPAAVRRVERLLARRRLAHRRRLVVVHTGASAPSRRWPAQHFAAACRALVRDLGAAVVLTGSAAERPLVDGIRRDMGVPALSLAGALGLAELGALIARADCLVANNTGPVHLAAGLGTPVVDLYAATNPQHTPWRVAARVLTHDVPCRGCYRSVCPEGHHACLRLVPPEAVVHAVATLLADAPATAASSA